ncbi:MAG: cytochrome c oxidase subunit II, partial [Gemmatimonadota bacterium]
IYYLILIITGIVFVATEALLLWFVFRYRHKEGRTASYIHGSLKAEVIWTVTPFVIVLGIAFMSRGVWAEIRDPDRIPEGAVEVIMTGSQFEWNATYPGPDGQLETDDDFVSRNVMHVPVDRPVVVRLRAEDVLHSFFVPDLRVKQDAVPGMEIPVWFEATETGEYPLACAELCGLGHYRMGATLIVDTQDDYEAWIQAQSDAGGDAE